MAIHDPTPTCRIPSPPRGENIECGHVAFDAHEADATPTKKRNGQTNRDTQTLFAASQLNQMDEGQSQSDTQSCCALAHPQNQSLGHVPDDAQAHSAEALSNNGSGQSFADTQVVDVASDLINGGGQAVRDTQSAPAPADSINYDCQVLVDTQKVAAVTASNNDGGGQALCDTRSMTASAVFADIRHHYRLRVRYHKAEKSLTLQCKAMLRSLCDGDKKEANKMFDAIEGGQMSGDTQVQSALLIAAVVVCEPFLVSRALFKTYRMAEEKVITKLVKTLPIWPWVKAQCGLGALSFACLVGETGDLNNYATVSKVWKRMGYAVIRGQRQRKTTDEALAIEMGYSPSRHSVGWNIGAGFIRQKENEEKGKTNGYYRTVYLKFLADEATDKAQKVGLIPTTTSKDTIKNWKDLELPPLTLVKEHDGKLHRSAGHMVKRAQRRMEKEFLIDLWCAWTGNSRSKAKK